MKSNTCNVAVLLIITFLLIMAKPLSHIFAQTSSTTVNATIKISVCGNSAVEGSEDCEGSNLNGKSCTSLGYSSGSLSCDIACSFDTSACISPTPTPTNTPTPTTTATPTPSSSSSSNDLPSSTPTATDTPVPSPTPNLPASLELFDINGIGKILTSDLSEVVKLWVDEWKKSLTNEFGGLAANSDTKKCDVNSDKNCDMKDFSVLMYYVDR